jgi:hypothetical protein
MHTDPPERHSGHDAGRDVADSSTPGDQFNPENPGYETTDVNVNGVAVFLAGLFGALFVFFWLCFAMGRVINNLFEKQDGGATKWRLAANDVPPQNGLKNLANNPEMAQEQLHAITNTFPEPRLEDDDSAQQTADLHTREDLLLDHYSRATDPYPIIRIPIERAMQLIVQRGLPLAEGAQNAQPAQGKEARNQALQSQGPKNQGPQATQGANQGSAPVPVAYSAPPKVQAPLTKGFARTAVELEMIQSREQRLQFGNAESTR